MARQNNLRLRLFYKSVICLFAKISFVTLSDMSQILWQSLAALGSFLMMEAWAWFMHKYLLHGPFWFLHKSHHEPHKGWLEWNDVVSVFNALVAMGLIMHGIEYNALTLGVGIGITAYGFVYFLFHDVIIHRRIKFKQRYKSSYINRLIRAHKMHHKHLRREDGEAFGFLYAPKKYAVTRVEDPRKVQDTVGA
ncbi:MAG: hypothetical protein OHK0039_32330 [Bacteroidia bacterium]